MKSDGEPALVAVREALARCHGGRVTPEQPPEGEHQANGLAEVTGRHVSDHVRVLKLHLQKRLWRKVLEDESAMARRGKMASRRTNGRRAGDARWKRCPSER